MTTTRPVPAPDIQAVASRILPAGAPSASPGLAPPGHTGDEEHLDLRAVVTAPGDARHFAAGKLKDWQAPPEVIETTRSIVSELITNAYQAASSNADVISLTLRRLPGQIVIEVSDNDSLLPVKSYATDYAENGRGLLMVEALSEEWGCELSRSGGKIVYAIVRIP